MKHLTNGFLFCIFEKTKSSRMIIVPFCLYFRLIHFIFSSKTQKIVFNKLEYRF